MKIEQHIYTRERKGMFRQSPGYDTIAASAGLSHAFIKEHLHPYCTYSAPAALKNTAATDYPPAITVVNYICGRMLLSRAVYVPVDFTGQRSTFFVHNYVLPPRAAANALADMGSVLRNTKFLDAYDIANGSKLDSLDDLPTENRHFAPQEIELGQLSQHVQESVATSKKTYVTVPAESQNIHDYASGLLAQLYPRLPEHTKHRLGICTYAREPQNKKGLHLIFVEKNSTPAGDFSVRPQGVALDTNAPSLETYLQAKIPTMTPEKFFSELGFWKARMENFAECTWLQAAERGWLEAMLECLTQSQFASIPGEFINRGKALDSPEIYMMLGIFKTVAGVLGSRAAFDLRYFLGSYPLNAVEYERVLFNLRRLYSQHVTPANLENIAFLFRERASGVLDAEGLESYLEKFSSSPIDGTAGMLRERGDTV